MFQKVTKGALSGKAGETAEGGLQDQRPVRQHAGDRRQGGVVGIPFFDSYVEKAALEFLDEAAKSPDKPFFINVNFMKVHQPNMPAPEFEHKSLSKSKYADSVVELDTRIGRIMDKLRAARPGQEHARLLHDRQRRLAGRLSRRRLHAVPRHQGHRARRRQPRSGDRRVAGQDQGRVEEPRHRRRPRPDGDLRLASAGVKLPEKDREGQPIIFDSYDMSPVLFGTGKSPRKNWFYFTENELTPGRRPRRQLQGRVQPARRQRRRPPAAWRSTPTSAGRARRSMSPPCRRSSTSGRTRRSATTSS